MLVEAAASTFPNILTPKLAALQTQLDDAKARMQEPVSYAGVLKALAHFTEEAERVRRLAELLVAQMRGFSD